MSSGAAPLPDEPPDEQPDEVGEPLGPVEVPDDLRELAFEADAVRRELAAQRRRERLTRVLRTRTWERYGLSGPLVAAVLIAVALVGGLSVALGPRPGMRLLPQPLAPAPVGGEGGLLPVTPLTIGATTVPVRALRPSVVALVPDGCDCAIEAEQVIGQAASFRLPTYLVATPDSVDDVDALRATRRVRGEGRAVDERGELAVAYGAVSSGLTLLLVRADGVVVDVVRGFSEGQRLEPSLVDLARASGLR